MLEIEDKGAQEAVDDRLVQEVDELEGAGRGQEVEGEVLDVLEQDDLGTVLALVVLAVSRLREGSFLCQWFFFFVFLDDLHHL